MDDADRTQSDLQVDRDLRKFVQGEMLKERADDPMAASRRRVAQMLFGPSEDEAPSQAEAGSGDEGAATIRKIHRYEVRALIGSGAMGRVFEAYDPKLARPLAIKVLHPGYSDEEKARARIVREAQSLARLSHPNVIQVYDVGDSEVGFFIAMEWVWGDTLRTVVKKSRPEQWRMLMERFLDAGEGLAAAHKANLVHRDFKPENVIVGHDQRVRVLDFGLARPSGPGSIPKAEAQAAAQSLSGERKNLGLTQTGAMIGTPIYMAPELYKGATADPKSDQFAYCVALYDALYRQRPFDGNNVETYAKAVVAGEICSPSSAATASCPDAILGILRKGLSVDPKDRYPSMADLLRALREAIAIPVPAARRRRRNFAILLGACLLTAVVVSQVREGPWDRWRPGGNPVLAIATDTGGQTSTSVDAQNTGESSAKGSSGTSDSSSASTSAQDADTSSESQPKAVPKPPSKTRPRPAKKAGSDARRSGWCSLHEDTYRLLRRDRRRKTRFRSRNGRCFSCRIEERKSRTRQFHPRDCQGYQLCGPTADGECGS